jgi:hypothetical protein
MYPGTLECAVYLYRTQKDAKAGVRSGGSGFLVEVPSEEHEEHSHIYAVTNSHVIEEKFSVVRFNTKDGEVDFHNVGPSEWTSHPDGDDVAVCQILVDDLDSHYDIAPIPIGKFLPKSCQVGKYRVTPGAETYLIGRFSHGGIQRNTPSVRFGHVAMMASETEKVLQSGRRIGGKKQNFEQESFLVDVLTIGGYSGSPVYVYFPNEQSAINFAFLAQGLNVFDESPPGFPEFLLGVHWGSIPEYRPVVDEHLKEHSAGWQVAGDTSMAGVVPAWRLDDLLMNHEDLKMQRKKIDENIAHRKRKDNQRVAGILQSSKQRPRRKPEESISLSGFDSALKRVSRKIDAESKKK